VPSPKRAYQRKRTRTERKPELSGGGKKVKKTRIKTQTCSPEPEDKPEKQPKKGGRKLRGGWGGEPFGLLRKRSSYKAKTMHGIEGCFLDP